MTLVAPLADGLDAMRALLMFNFLSVDTGGVRMGLSALDRSVYMIRDIPDADLSVHAVQGACRGLADLAAKWAAILAALEAQADAAPAAAQLA
jgi:hypothetical protein